jgi:hypothetical protein
MMKRSRGGSSTASIPVPSEFDICHMVDPSIPPLAGTKNTYPSLNNHDKQQLVIDGKLVSWNQGTIQVKSADHKEPCAKAIACGDQLVLQNVVASSPTSVAEKSAAIPPIAICRQKFALVGKVFKVYTPQPCHADQAKSSCCDYNGMAMYMFATVERAPFSSTLQARFANQSSSSSIAYYTIHRVASTQQSTKMRMVRNNQNGGKMAAFMENRADGSTLLSINAGIDPYLMVCLAAICDELDQQ